MYQPCLTSSSMVCTPQPMEVVEFHTSCGQQVRQEHGMDPSVTGKPRNFCARPLSQLCSCAGIETITNVKRPKCRRSKHPHQLNLLPFAPLTWVNRPTLLPDTQLSFRGVLVYL